MTVKRTLADTILEPDEAYEFEILAIEESQDSILYDIRLTSQCWRGRLWAHRLVLSVPRTPLFPDLAFLMIGADYSSAALPVKLPHPFENYHEVFVACLYDIPNQPLFDGKIEDEIIAHTFSQYLDTGDPDWILLSPMTKSVLRAMDAVQELCNSQHDRQVSRFVLNGASKRGWTTWLSAATDSRVVAIAPQVFDNLNFPAQMERQMETLEGYSEMISDYTAEGLQDRMQSPEGVRLTQMVDPYAYRHLLTIPKLFLNGTNDLYWTTAALNLYWEGLTGDKHIVYAPNCGHSFKDPERLKGGLYGLIRSIGSGIPLPQLAWEFQETDEIVAITVSSDSCASQGRLWFAHSSNEDFRSSNWMTLPMELVDTNRGQFRGQVPLSPGMNMAVYGELQFPQDASPLHLSTQMQIVRNPDSNKRSRIEVPMAQLSHLDENGKARMVDVSEKDSTSRRAVASGRVLLSPETVTLLRDGKVPKGDALTVAKIAGIMGAKKTSDLIPLCHPLPISKVSVDLRLCDFGVEIEAEVRVTGKTGVEMEALTAVSIAALTVYDMVKAVEKSASITDIRLETKTGGKSGDFTRD